MFLIIKICLLSLILVGQGIYASDTIVKLGGSNVIIKQITHGRGKFFVHLHKNEITALAAAKSVIRTSGGTVLTLVHNGGRNISFTLAKRRYQFDPNRIFTSNGIKRTLKQFGAYTVAAHKEVQKLANGIKRLLPGGKIIAVHNNRSYSLKYYLPGSSLANDALKVNYVNKRAYRNFYLVTRKSDFNRLKSLNFNVILQARNAFDDGSLSIYLSRQSYINVEAGYGQLSYQIKMLQNS